MEGHAGQGGGGEGEGGGAWGAEGERMWEERDKGGGTRSGSVCGCWGEELLRVHVMPSSRGAAIIFRAWRVEDERGALLDFMRYEALVDCKSMLQSC